MQVLVDARAQRRILAAAATAAPAEACGLLVGRRIGRVTLVARAVVARNRARQPHREFAIDPRLFVRVERWATARDWTVLGVFHSHPNGPPAPSRQDRTHAWPEHLQVLVARTHGRWGLRLWSNRDRVSRRSRRARR